VTEKQEGRFVAGLLSLLALALLLGVDYLAARDSCSMAQFDDRLTTSYDRCIQSVMVTGKEH